MEMKKCIHVVYINDFFPELWKLTFPTIKAYADRIGADLNVINERLYNNDVDINYEKMQVWYAGADYDANFLVDADVLIHRDFPDKKYQEVVIGTPKNYFDKDIL